MRAPDSRSILAGLLSLALLPVAAGAQQAPPPAAAKAAAARQLKRATVSVDGFRSAKFGMLEADVRAAIAKDFNIKGDGVRESENPVEHTRVLSIAVPDLIPHGGKAEVAYVLGYKTHKLIQIGATWSIAADKSINADTLLANGNALQALFMSQGYKPDTIITNAALSTGALLMFRGFDNQGHATTLILGGTTAPSANGGQTLTPNMLTLFYVENPENPDALAVKVLPGQF